MSKHVSDFVLHRLSEWGIYRVFGYPGDGINGFLGAFDRANGHPEFIQARHEEMAAFEACAHAKFTGEIGCCIATSGPGAVHLLNGLYDARLDHQPVLAIVGQQKRMALGAHYQQEIDLDSLFKDVSVYVHTCMEPSQARQLIDRGIRTALAERGVATLIFPEDVQESPAVPSPPRVHGAVYTSVGYTKPRIVAPDAELDRAAQILNDGQKVAMLIGQGAAEATDEVKEAADLLGAGVAKALLGKDALADDLPFVTGPIGLLGSKPSYDMMMECDTLFMVGTSFPYAEWLPKEGQARCVEIDIDARMIGSRYPADVHLVGDSRETLRALIPRLQRKIDRSWRQEIEDGISTWWDILDDRATQHADPMNPQRVAHELSKRLPDNAILTADSGSSTNWWARHLKLRPGMKASLSGTLATMGPGVPYAVAAKLAFPDRPVIAFVGDGAATMIGLLEMITAQKYQDRFLDRNPTLIFCIFKNHDLNQVTWEQRVMAGDPRYPGSQSLPDFPFARYAELLGFKGITCDEDEGIGDAWDEALAADRPVILEAVVDPDVPPLPPHIKFEQARKMAHAILGGDEDSASMLIESAKGKFVEFKESFEHR
jgi:pyruvate dehydrogenase (quinone)